MLLLVFFHAWQELYFVFFSLAICFDPNVSITYSAQEGQESYF